MIIYRKLIDCFRPSETVTSQHALFDQYVEGERKDMPKMVFYMSMWKNFGHPTETDEKGNLGYKLEFIPKKKNS